MAFFQHVISTVANALGDLRGIIPIGEYNATPPVVTDGQAINLQVDAAGNLKVASSGTSTLPTGAATEAKQDAQVTALGTLHTDIVTLGGLVDGLEGFTDGLEGYTDGIEGKLDTIHADLYTTLAGKLDTIWGGIDSVEGYLSSIHSDLGDTIHYDLSTTIAGKLDSIYGGIDTVEAGIAVLHTDITGNLKSYSPELAPVTIRTFSGTIGDTVSPGDGASWATIPGSDYTGYLDIYPGTMTVGGSVAPTQAAFQIWNRVGGSGGAIKKIDEFSVDASKIALPALTNPYTRRHIPCNSANVYATVTFPDGTAPTITGVLSGRAVAKAGLQRRDIIFNPDTGHWVIEDRAFDSATSSNKNSPTVLECDLVAEEPLVVNLASQIAGTVYAPSETGKVMLPNDSISVEFKAIAGSGGTVTVTFEATNGSNAWAQVNDITLSGSSDTLGQRLTAAIVAGSSATISDLVQFDNLNVALFRVKFVVATQTSGAITCSLRSKVRGS